MAKRIKEKALKIAEEREKRPHAYARNIRISPSKVRVVLKHIRGKSVNDALAMLEATPKAASPVVSKLIKSAVANAEHNLDIPRIDLFVAEIFADPGPTLKRAMARAKGRSYAILKRTSHITVILDSVKTAEPLTKKEASPVEKKAAVKKDAVKKEASQPAPVKKEMVKKEAAKPASEKKAAPAKKEAAPKAAKEAVIKDAPEKTVAAVNEVKEEAVKEEAVKEETVKEEAVKEETTIEEAK